MTVQTLIGSALLVQSTYLFLVNNENEDAIVPKNLDFSAGIPDMMRGCTYYVKGNLIADIAQLAGASLKDIASTRISTKLTDKNLVEIIGPLELWIPYSAYRGNILRTITAVNCGLGWGMIVVGLTGIQWDNKSLKERIGIIFSSCVVGIATWHVIGYTSLQRASITLLPPGVAFTRHWLGFVRTYFTRSV